MSEKMRAVGIRYHSSWRCMPESSPPSVNSWLEDELYHQYLNDRQAVDTTWKQIFEGNGHDEPAPVAAVAAPPRTEAQLVPVAEGDQLVALRGPALRIAENMTASLTMPVATSQRAMPVKVMDENRRAINQHRSLQNQSKISYPHLVAWEI